VLQVNTHDNWCWVPDSVTGYTVRGAYHSLVEDLAIPPSASSVVEPSIWRKDVPLKVSIFAWRLLRNRLTTKDNLYRRRIIQEEAQLCISGCGKIEMTDHLFLHCDVFGQVLQLVWLGVSSVTPFTISYYYLQIGSSSGISKSQCSFMYLIWFASTWVIWKERNARIF